MNKMRQTIASQTIGSTHIDRQLGVTKIVRAALDGNEGRTKGFRDIGANVKHIRKHLANLGIIALRIQDIIEALVGLFLFG
jgi:hypothetical protein